ncbi:MAG: ferritin [Elusimicrobiota bacterium]
MAISKKLEKAINRQINRELWSAYLYMSMASYLDSVGLEGFARWMKAQTKEEMTHAEKLYNHLTERDGRAVMDDLEAPPSGWESVMDVFEYTYKHEQKVTSLINDLMELAIEERDHAAQNMLNWFVEEQVEEEDSVKKIIDKLNLVDQTTGGIYMLDKEMGQRVFTPPQTEEN